MNKLLITLVFGILICACSKNAKYTGKFRNTRSGEVIVILPDGNFYQVRDNGNPTSLIPYKVGDNFIQLLLSTFRAENGGLREIQGDKYGGIGETNDFWEKVGN